MNLESARVRKFIGMIGMLLFLLVYVVTVAKLSAFLPDQWAVKLIYYAVFGICWGFPLFPLLSWMNRGK